ncbi:hypothetical protein HDE_09353 [Halotydeus destructor]|nr:hypothetical protein HDE_09353 [Halotydeus destructor]
MSTKSLPNVIKEKPPTDVTGMSLITASVFIVGEMAGSGILALPAAVSGTGWIGILIIAICCLAAGCSAVFLGKSWLIVEELYPEYRNGDRDPYAIIGYKAIGEKTKIFVTINIVLQLFGVSVVFLLLSSELVFAVVSTTPYLSTLQVCDWILILGLALIPFTWFGSPQDFPLVAFAAMGSTAVSVILVLVMFAKEAEVGFGHVHYDVVNSDAKSFFLSFGTIIFAFGGAATFPTFQNDMKDKSKFPAAVTFGFIMLLCFYLPIAFGGLSLIVVTWKRFVFRTTIGLIVILTGLSVPKFGKVLNLVGGSTISLTTFILPPIFYIALLKKKSKESGHKVSILTIIVAVTITLMGITGGIAATYSSLTDLFGPNAFTKPCFSQLFRFCT